MQSTRIFSISYVVVVDVDVVVEVVVFVVVVVIDLRGCSQKQIHTRD
jgi:hypothetical protein